MRHNLAILPLVLLASSGWVRAQNVQPLSANEIMARVAANQDRAEELRKQYVYKQHVHVVSRKTNGKLMCEEAADYDVFPGAQGSSKKLTQLLGKYWYKGQYLNYSAEPAPPSTSLDNDLVSDFRSDLISDVRKDVADENRSKDGLAVDLFPLSSKEQKKYQFKMLGEQAMNGRSVYRLGFEPKDKSDIDWAGEAFIDKEDFQPVLVFTKLSRKIPFFVRTALGTNLPDLGFSVSYKRQPDGVWFPTNFGTEFRLKALFVLNRNISISLSNSDFKHTHVDSTVHYAAQAP